jgi:hypothetical protein
LRLSADDDRHLIVGSGNLTFGGWGGNFEVLEHLHPSFAADAIADAADFFDRLSGAEGIQHGAAAQCQAVAEELRAAIGVSRRNGDIRLYHSLDGAIAEKLAQAVQDLGGAQRLIVASPFWDTGLAIDRLTKQGPVSRRARLCGPRPLMRRHGDTFFDGDDYSATALLTNDRSVPY